MSVEFFDYGTNVDVSAPPADQVADARALQGLFGDSGGGAKFSSVGSSLN